MDDEQDVSESDARSRMVLFFEATCTISSAFRISYGDGEFSSSRFLFYINTYSVPNVKKESTQKSL